MARSTDNRSLGQWALTGRKPPSLQMRSHRHGAIVSRGFCVRTVGTAVVACLLSMGCNQRTLATKVVEGSVTYGGEKVPMGDVLFVPIEDTRGPASVAPIVDGQYRIEARGGVPLGKHRVQIDARRKTGRSVPGSNGREPGLIAETVRLGPPSFAETKSPLVVEVTEQSNGRFDFDLPTTATRTR